MKRLIVVRRTCQHMATKMGDLPEETVEIGGLVPRFFTDQENLPVGLRPHLEIWPEVAAAGSASILGVNKHSEG